MSVKKKKRLTSIDVDFKEFALVANYNTEVHHLDPMGNPLGSESQPGTKVIPVPRGLAIHDIPRVAQEVVENSKYIPPSKFGEVQRLLQVLIQHEDTRQQSTMSTPTATATRKRQEPLLPPADVRQLEEYADQLYEDNMDMKVSGAKRILSLCTDPATLELVIDGHANVLGVLSRELRESSKKSLDLSVAIVCTFLTFSHFRQFHPFLMQHQCGDVTLRVLTYESQRHQVRREDMDKRMKEHQERGSQVTGDEKKQLAKEEKKYRIQLARQNKLLLVCLMSLLNLAEEVAVERKMVNRKIPQLVAGLLDRNHEELLLVALHFLKKLVVFEENKEEIAKQETLKRLVQLSQDGNIRVALLSLRVLYNLSFDEAVRAVLVEAGLVKLLVDLLRNPPFRHIVLRLLYQFSMDDQCKSLMAYYQDGMIMLLQLVVHFPDPRVGKDLVALVVNLSTSPRAAEVMLGSGLFPQVMLRVLKTRDPLLCKVIRNVSSHRDVVEPMYELLESDSVRMSKWMSEMVRMALCGVDNPDLLVEVIGTLANMTLPEIEWCDLCEAGLVDLLHRVLVPSFSEDDVVLESVMLIGNIAQCTDAVGHIAGSRIPSMLHNLLIEKRDDEEIVVQLLFTLQCMLSHEGVRDVVCQENDIAPVIMRFARSRSPMILEQATRTLEVVADHLAEAGANEEGVPSWIEQIKSFRYEQHNAEWCHYVNRELSGGASTSPPSGHGGYYDDQEDTGDDEEEFAFHWAGVHAADVDDLANREWGNQDPESFMHTSRYVS